MRCWVYDGRGIGIGVLCAKIGGSGLVKHKVGEGCYDIAWINEE